VSDERARAARFVAIYQPMNSPSNAAVLRSLIIYAICVPLAIAVGYSVTNPMDYSTFGIFAVLALLLVSPLLLRWHHPLLILSWNLGATMFFIKSSPNIWLVMVALSLGLSVLERSLSSQMHFIRMPEMTWPLICLAGVMLITAKFTGGFGVRAFGSSVYGGNKYVYMMAGILSYFALTARRIPPERAVFYVGLFFLSGVMKCVADLFPIMPSWTHFIFWFFPPNYNSFSTFDVGQTRLGGFSAAGQAIWCFVMARYGIRGIFLSGRPWRLFMFFLSFSMLFLGGFRFQLIFVGTIFTLQFFVEGLHRTRLLAVFAWVGIMAAVAIVPLASKLPFTVQRTLAFLPLHLNTEAKQEAQSSWDWRVRMWKALMPEIPQYLLLGKGLSIRPEDFNEVMGRGNTMGSAAASFDASQEPLALASDFHNGPLSVIIPFGIWGCIAVLWLFAACIRVTYCNFKYGDPSLHTINVFLFVEMLVAVIMFLFEGGSLSYDVMGFTGFAGLSGALNGGMCQPTPQLVPAREAFPRPRGALPEPRPRPAFPR
jgi:hypothetical protein